MSEPHRIRLRGPWEVIALEASSPSPLPLPTRMAIPCCWKDGGWPGFSGRALHRRAFGRPRQVDAGERVWLVIESVAGHGDVRLGGEVVGSIRGGEPFALDITVRLQPRNLLEVELSEGSDAGGITGEVRLEIRSLVY